MDRVINIKKWRNIIILIIIFAGISIGYIWGEYPYIVGDEIIYKGLAFEIWQGQPVSTVHYPILYPLCIAISFHFGQYFWRIMYLINIFIKIIGIIVSYKFLMHIVSEKTATMICVLIGFSPIYFIYSRYIMSENLFAPLLIINILFHIVYAEKKKRDCFSTTIAAMLTLGLYATKYLGLVLVPVFFLYWILGTIDGRNWRGELQIVLKRSLVYIGTIVLLIILYAIYYGYMSQQSMSFTLLKEVMGFYIGSGPENTGYQILPSWKWIACYSLYAVLGAMPLIAAIIKRKGIMNQAFKFKRYELFLLCIVIGFIYIAARHSSFVSYNADGLMVKLLGRYVAYITPVVSVLFGILYEKTTREEKCGLFWGKSFLCTGMIILSIWILYGGGVWKREADWLSGARGVENAAFLLIPVMPFLLVALTLGILYSIHTKICVIVNFLIFSHSKPHYSL